MNSFVESQFSWCPLIWMYCSKTANDKINRIHERALRIVYLDYTSTFEELLLKDKSVNIHQRNIQLVAIEMFKVLKKIGPEIIRSLFIIDNPNSDKPFRRPHIRTENWGRNSIRYFGTKVWNEMLPKELKSIENLEEFETKVKEWVPTMETCRCNLCTLYIAGVGYVNTS